MPSVKLNILFSSACKQLLRQVEPATCYRWIECDQDSLVSQAQKKQGIAAILIDESLALASEGLLEQLRRASPRSSILLFTNAKSQLNPSKDPAIETLEVDKISQLSERLAKSIERYVSELQADIQDCLARR